MSNKNRQNNGSGSQSSVGTKSIVISILVGAFFIVLAIFYTSSGSTTSAGDQGILNGNNVSVVDGKQIIELRAKGGYQPRISVAKAGVPTVLRINTRGTFDCSSSVRIPSLRISKLLPQTGSTDIELGTPEAGNILGSCGMGMYPFELDFN